MKLTLTNQGAEALPIYAPKNDWADALFEGVPMSIDDDTVVLIIGDKPDVRDQLEQAAHVLSEVARRVIDAVTNRADPSPRATAMKSQAKL